jgi:hypothetical protein
MRRRQAGVRGLLGALGMAVLTGCGVAPESQPRPITPPRGPFQAVIQPTAAAVPTGTESETLFLVRDDAVVAVTRHVRSSPTVQTVLYDLQTAPNDAERTAGLSNALLGARLIADAAIVDGQARVELATPIEGAAPSGDRLAYAQVVCTLTSLPNVSTVVFTRGNQPIGVPEGDGSVSLGPLSCANYTDVIAAE